MDCSPSGFSVPGILLARIMEWLAISFSSKLSSSCLNLIIWGMDLQFALKSLVYDPLRDSTAPAKHQFNRFCVYTKLTYVYSYGDEYTNYRDIRKLGKEVKGKAIKST